MFLEIMQCTQIKFLSPILTSLVFTFDCKIKKKLNQHSNSLESGFNENELTYIQPHDEFLSPILISLVFTFDCKIKKKNLISTVTHLTRYIEVVLMRMSSHTFSYMKQNSISISNSKHMAQNQSPNLEFNFTLFLLHLLLYIQTT